eukprot:2813936-Pyramimonas_sp.AAC.1
MTNRDESAQNETRCERGANRSSTERFASNVNLVRASFRFGSIRHDSSVWGDEAFSPSGARRRAPSVASSTVPD